MMLKPGPHLTSMHDILAQPGLKYGLALGRIRADNLNSTPDLLLGLLDVQQRGAWVYSAKESLGACT